MSNPTPSLAYWVTLQGGWGLGDEGEKLATIGFRLKLTPMMACARFNGQIHSPMLAASIQQWRGTPNRMELINSW